MATLQEVMSHVRGWPRALRWSEFTHLTTSRLPPHTAECAATFELVSMPMVRSGSGATVNPAFVINVYLTMAPSQGDTGTWVVNGSETAELLRHEQGHYDLAGLAAREYSRELLEFIAEGGMDPGAIPARVNAMNDQIVSELATINRRYDHLTLGTNHGLNQRIQDKWDRFIPGHIQNFLEPQISWIENPSVILSG